jgi:hypothetical protein
MDSPLQRIFLEAPDEVKEKNGVMARATLACTAINYAM